MELEHAIRTRRTHKVFAREAVDRDTLEALFELARWAPNHRVTNPWRFRVIGPDTLERLVAAAEVDAPGSGSKLRRSPTLVAVTAAPEEDPVLGEENVHATAIAAYIVLVGAHERGLAGYWRTPSVLRCAAGREVLGIPAGEVVLGMLCLGTPIEERRAPERAPVDTFTSFLP